VVFSFRAPPGAFRYKCASTFGKLFRRVSFENPTRTGRQACQRRKRARWQTGTVIAVSGCFDAAVKRRNRPVRAVTYFVEQFYVRQ
jgi:hypothetical protein